MKKWLCFVLAFVLLAAALCGCGKKEPEESAPTLPPANSPTEAPPPVSAAPVQMAKAARVRAADGLNIRSGPSTDSEILGLAENSSLLPLLTENPTDGWYQVSYKNATAYVYADYVQVQDITLEMYNQLKNGTAASSGDADPQGGSQSGGDVDPQGGSQNGGDVDPQGGAQASATAAPVEPVATPTIPPKPIGGGEDGE